MTTNSNLSLSKKDVYNIKKAVSEVSLTAFLLNNILRMAEGIGN